MNFPKEPFASKPFGSMSDDELYQMRRDFSQFYDRLGKVAARCKQRARAVQSMIDRREADRLAGKEPRISDNQEMPKQDRKWLEATEAAKTGPVTISDHALVRYLERAKGYDMVALRLEIAERILTGESYFGGSVITDADGFTYIRRPDGFIKTVIPKDWLSEDDMAIAEDKFDEFAERHGNV